MKYAIGTIITCPGRGDHTVIAISNGRYPSYILEPVGPSTNPILKQEISGVDHHSYWRLAENKPPSTAELLEDFIATLVIIKDDQKASSNKTYNEICSLIAKIHKHKMAAQELE